jgi:hypothetical protein
MPPGVSKNRWPVSAFFAYLLSKRSLKKGAFS